MTERESLNPPRAIINGRVPDSYGALLVFLFSGSGAWALLLGIVGPLVAKTLWWGWSLLDIPVLAAFVLFRGVIEWCIHAWLYHARPLPFAGLRLASGVSEAHLRHHRDPGDIDTLLITWRGVLAVFIVTFVVSFVLLQNVALALTFVAGFAISGAFIEVVHLICHCQIPHRHPFMRRIVRLHRLHHHVDAGHYFGVSSSLGDRLFGTAGSGPVRPSTDRDRL